LRTAVNYVHLERAIIFYYILIFKMSLKIELNPHLYLEL
jgi:hypothetical protein